LQITDCRLQIGNTIANLQSAICNLQFPKRTSTRFRAAALPLPWCTSVPPM
jgi:hypothetical protein